MDIETVRHLIQLMVDNDLSELEVQEGQTRVALKRRGEAVVGAVPAPPPVAVSHIAAPPSPAPSGQESPEARPEDKLITITSPMVGTFFAAHDPESPPYVQVGSEVEPDTVVCICLLYTSPSPRDS